MSHSAVHMNGNLFCTVDTETTGLKAGFHDMLQLCILPLGPDIKPSKKIPFFELRIQPWRPENLDLEANTVNRGLYAECINTGIERWAAVDLLERWFKKLNLPFMKKIIPLGCNYVFDRGFLVDFMGGYDNYSAIFRDDFRDVQACSRMINDLCDFHSEPMPFPKHNLSYLCNKLGVEHINKHDAIGDCVATTEVYRRLMRYKSYWAISDEKAPET